MNDLNCLSLIELAELRRTTDGFDVEREHLSSCQRCQALLRDLPDVPNEPARDVDPLALHLVRRAPNVNKPAAGQVWLANAKGETDWRFPIVVIGVPRQRNEVVLVAPLSTDIEQATDSDLVISDTDTIGYPFFAAVWDYGQIAQSQLVQCVGVFNPQKTDDLRRLFRYLSTGDGESPEGVGPPVLSTQDPRRIHRSELAEHNRPLFAPLHRKTEASDHTESVPLVTVSQLLIEALHSSEWDKVTLLETAHLDQEQFERFLGDRLELRHQSDVAPLARTFQVLHYTTSEDFKEPVWNSMRSSPGGWVEGSTDSTAIAARSYSYVSDADRTSDLFDDQLNVDESDAGRAKAMKAYWELLVETFDELGK